MNDEERNFNILLIFAKQCLHDLSIILIFNFVMLFIKILRKVIFSR